MSVLFTAADNDSVSETFTAGVSSPFGTYPIGYTVLFKVSTLPASNGSLFWVGRGASSSNYLDCYLKPDGTVEVWDRGNGLTAIATANQVLTDGTVNVLTVVLDKNSTKAGKPRCRVQLNGGATAVFNDTTHSDANCATWDKFSFGRRLTPTPNYSFSGQIEQPLFFTPVGDDTDFDDHDLLWNSGSPLDPSGETISESHRYPFNGTSGNAVQATDTEIDDAVGSLDLTTVGGSPEYRASFWSISPVVQGNGFDIEVGCTSTSVGNYTVKAGALGSETTRTIQSVTALDASTVRIRLANGERIYSTDASVLVSSTADGVTDESGTNSSVQTSTTVAIPTPNGGYVVHTFASAPTVGILAAGDLSVTNAVALNSVAYTAATGEEQYTIHGSCLNPACGPSAQHPFHPDGTQYSAGTAASFPLSLSADDCLITAVALPAIDTHATSTAFALGDSIYESGRYWRCTTAGTTAGSKPTFPTSGTTPVTDGTAEWTPGGVNGTGDDGTSLVRKMVVLHCAGASLKSQDTYRCPFTSTATKTYFTRSDVAALPGDSTGYSNVATAEGKCEYLWWDLGRDGSSGQSVGPEESHPTVTGLYGQNLQNNSAIAVLTCLSDQTYGDRLLDYVIQRGIDQIGMREGGGYWQGNGGHGQGKLAFAIAACGLLSAYTTALIARIKTNANTSGDWDHTEFTNQVFYVAQTDIDRLNTDGYDYDPGTAQTYIDPANAPSTYSDSPAAAYFPATIRDNWLHVPEWGINYDNDKTQNDPRWALAGYRRCCTAQSWASLAYTIGVFGLVSEFPEAWFDYMDRYQYIQGPDGDNDYWINDTAWTLYEGDRDAYAITSWSRSGTTVTVNFNRYTTGTDAAWAAALAISGGITLASPLQTGPRTWQFTASSAPAAGSTLTYTAASGDAMDAGANALGDQTNVVVFEVTSRTPTSVAKGATVDITVTGTGFVDGIAATSNYAGAFTVNSTTWNSSTEVVVNVTGGSGTAGNYVNAITLTNPDGQTDSFALTLISSTTGQSLHSSNTFSLRRRPKVTRSW